MPGSSKWYLSLGFSQQTPLYASPFNQTCHMPRAPHSSRFYYPKNSGWEVQITKLLIMKFSPLPCYPFPLRSKYSPQHRILKYSQPTFLLSVSDQVSHSYKTTGKIINLYIILFKFLDSKLEDTRFCTEWWQTFPEFNPPLISSWIEFWFVTVIPHYLNSLPF
jgi:hypothetical protein